MLTSFLLFGPSSFYILWAIWCWSLLLCEWVVRIIEGRMLVVSMRLSECCEFCSVEGDVRLFVKYMSESD